MEHLNTPVLLLLFNRPDKTKKVFESIRAVKPIKLYVAADGPRPGKDEEDLCAQTRDVVSKVDWKCDVHKLFRDKNLGCGMGPSTAMSWFFENEPEGIILEDDCLPDKSFFHFCEQLLEKYRDDTRIMQISGTNFHQDWIRDPDYSYYFSEIGLCWGWASWRRAWEKFDYNLSQYPEVVEKGYLKDLPFFRYGIGNYIAKELRAISKGQQHSIWDIQWNFAQFINSGLSIIPKKNLIENIGFDESATHTQSAAERYRVKKYQVEFPLKHPPYVLRDRVSDNRYLSVFYNRRFIHRVKKKVRKMITGQK